MPLGRKRREIRLGDDFLCEVDLDDSGEVVVGRTIKGEFKNMRLSAVNARAIKIASELLISCGGQIKRNPASENSI